MKKSPKNIQKQLDEVLLFLEDNYAVSQSDILQLIKNKQKEIKEEEATYIPISLFAATELSSLEAMTVYLRENKSFSFAQMGKLLGRNPIALSSSYRAAKKKYEKQIHVPESNYFIPATILRNKKLSVLENIVFYLKQEYRLTNAQISQLVKKDPRTIWTVLSRIKGKGVKA
ncbi:hypothetical protein HZA99_00910 [Candidatus Woesearchaeota archaeon]|nr:hypothetical protein [Candidatus Woesearchaeota archaeon]